MLLVNNVDYAAFAQLTVVAIKIDLVFVQFYDSVRVGQCLRAVCYHYYEINSAFHDVVQHFLFCLLV